MNAVIRDCFLYTCHHVGLSGTNGTYTGNETGTNVDRSGVQWLRINTDTNGQFLSVTNGRIYDRTNAHPYWYYFPSLMVNAAGDMVAGFSGSRSNGFIGAFDSWRAADGATANQPMVLRPGSDASSDSRWGDYSYTSLDPVDQMTFWTVQQYANDLLGNNYWGTWIAEIIPDVVNQ